MKSFYLLLLAIAITTVSCKTKEGEPGPAGASALKKQGTVSGTITYTDDNNNDATLPFNFEYYESIEENYFTYEENGSDSYYELDFQRRDLNDSNNRMIFYVEGNGTDGVEEDPSYSYGEFSFVTLINNDVYAFDSEDDIDVSNLTFDDVTGRLIFDFSGIVYDINNNEAEVTGRVDVIVNRLRQNNNPAVQ